jgi:hypothetical protein
VHLVPSCRNRFVYASQVAARLGGFGNNPSSNNLTGTAKGSLTYDSATAELKFATASATGRIRCGEFVDQKDERKPIVLLITNQKLPAEKWKSEGFLLLPSNF